MQKILFSFIAFCLVIAFFFSGQESDFADIEKSPNDQREYRAIKLENNLTVLLISDPTTDKAAAAMDVDVGSSDDPDNFLGLAHFLEHMLFLGTEKYPEADEYQKYISDHGGRHNAFTSLEHTNYFFDINANSIEGALDRFASQFTSPLFNEEYVEREVNAVHSEFSSKLKDDGRRYFSVMKELLSDDHPYSKFSVGNLTTLKDKPDLKIRDALLQFYAQHYSANKMKLVILGKESLSQLESWAIDKFSDIPNSDLESDSIDQAFFTSNFLPAKVEVKTIMDKRSMSIVFPVPSAFEHTDSQPLGFISNLIGHEGEGSLLSYLKERELVDSLGAGSQFDTKHHALVSISMGLTEKGLKNQKIILEALFAYIELVKQKGMQKVYFDEQAAMKTISFKYREKADPIHYVSGIANALQSYAPETVLSKHYKLSQFDPALYRQYLDLLTPDNMLISVSAISFEGDQTSDWYETPYKVSPLDPNLISDLSKPMTIAKLKLPEANEFIPDNTDFVVSETKTKPEQILEKTGIEVLYAPDIEFGTPKANLFVSIRSPITNQTASNRNLVELMVSLIKDNLNEFSYPAYLAGLNYDLYNHSRGVTLKISGYSDKQVVLLEKLITGIKNGTFAEDRFDIFKERLQRSLKNVTKKKPYEQAIRATQQLILVPSWSEEDRLVALEKTTLEDVTEFRDNFLKQLDLAILSTGNVTRETSLSVANSVEKELLEGTIRAKVERPKVLKLVGEQDWYREVKVDHPDTGLIYYLQGSDKSFKERARFTLLAQMLSPDFYSTLRTEKQLGYIVFATPFPLVEVPSLALIIQSPTASGPNLLREINKFLGDYSEDLKNLDSDTFERYRSAAISKLEEQDTNLLERSNRYWRQLDEENRTFDTREQVIAEIKSLSAEDLLSFYQELIQRKGQSLLSYTVNDATEGYSPEAFSNILEASLDTF